MRLLLFALLSLTPGSVMGVPSVGSSTSPDAGTDTEQLRPGAGPLAPITAVLSHLQELNLQQLEALYSLLDDDGSGTLTVHEMIDLFDGVDNVRLGAALRTPFARPRIVPPLRLCAIPTRTRH